MAVPNYTEANIKIWDIIPPGYRFRPFDDELITCYLENKVYGKPLPPNKIHEVELYGEYGPQDLAERNEAVDMDTWFYFTKRERKYENGERPNRTAGNGFWKATGKDECIKNNRGEVIGFKKNLAFFFGKQIGRNEKSTWLMQEFRLNDGSIKEKNKDNSNSKKLPKVARITDASQPKPKFMLDGYVLCKVYNHDKGKKSSPLAGKELQVVQHQATEQTPTSSDQLDGVKGKKRARVVSPVARLEYPVPLQTQHQQPQVMEQMTVVNVGDISDTSLTSYQNNMVFQQQPYVQQPQGVWPHQQHPSSQLPYVRQMNPDQNHFANNELIGSADLENFVLQASPLQRTSSFEINEGLQIQNQQHQIMEQITGVNHGDISDPTLTSNQNNMGVQQEPYAQQPQRVWPHQQQQSFQLPDVRQMNQNNFADNGLISSAAMENLVQPSPLQRTSSLDLFEALLDHIKKHGPNSIPNCFPIRHVENYMPCVFIENIAKNR